MNTIVTTIYAPLMVPIVINIDHLLTTTTRIGIAVGALVCGVIGATKPVFDIWGDTVSKYQIFGRNSEQISNIWEKQ